MTVLVHGAVPTRGLHATSERFEDLHKLREIYVRA
jgi:hypothetical protein